jgi:outer membrane biosynthesis protein TonB
MADGEAKKGKDRPYWLPFVMAIVMLLWLVYLFRNPEIVDLTGRTFTEWVTIGYLVTVIMLVWLLIWKITLNTEVATEAALATAAAAPAKKPTRPKPKPPEPISEEEMDEIDKAPEKPRKKRVVVAKGSSSSAAEKIDHDDELPAGLKRPEGVISDDVDDIDDLLRVVEYPKKEPGGVYSDTLLKVDENLILNYRILLGKVCHNCEELEDCKRRVEDKLSEDVFLDNFECKDGIKSELHKARKKREAEVKKAKDAKGMVEERAAKAKDAEDPAEKDKPRNKTPAKKKTTKKKTSSKKPSKKPSGEKKPKADK